MKYLLLLISINLLCSFSFSEEIGDEKNIKLITEYYTNKVIKVNELIPTGFSKSIEAKGDLNGDGLDEIALIIHQTVKIDPKGNSFQQGFDVPQYVIILNGIKGGDYKLWKLGTKHFLNSVPNFMDENGIGSFEIKKGVLTIQSSTALSMGGWSAGGCTQKWRNGKEGLQLIGLKIVSLDRKCDCGTTVDLNLLTGQEIRKSDKNSNDIKLKKMKVTNTLIPIKSILWNEFEYEKYCELQE